MAVAVAVELISDSEITFYKNIPHGGMNMRTQIFSGGLTNLSLESIIFSFLKEH